MFDGKFMFSSSILNLNCRNERMWGKNDQEEKRQSIHLQVIGRRRNTCESWQERPFVKRCHMNAAPPPFVPPEEE